MIMLTKRSGMQEPFKREKLKLALASASDEAGKPLNQSDLNNLSEIIEEMMEGRTHATTQQIYIMVSGLLYTRGLHDTLKAYTGYKNNAWR